MLSDSDPSPTSRPASNMLRACDAIMVGASRVPDLAHAREILLGIRSERGGCELAKEQLAR